MNFQTARLILRPRRPEDFEACRIMDSDPEVIRYVSAPWRNAAEHLAFLRRRIAASYPPGLGYWSIFAAAAPADFLGWIMLSAIATEGEHAGPEPEIEIGWRLKRAAWGGGYATEAAAPILAQGFARAPLKAVVADIHPDNLGSQRVAEKLGLKFSATVLYDGVPARRYKITRRAYERRQASTTRS
jgi:RimJ/RimL family protein N-acetyltransferase